MMTFKDNYTMILDEIHNAMEAVDEKQVESFIDMLLSAEKVFVVGAGRTILSLQAFAKRLNHIGIKTWFVGEINEPAITDRDLLVVGSGSGESVFPVAIANAARKYNARIVHIGSNPKSPLTPITNLFVRIPAKTKLNLADETNSKQIMSSLFEQCLYIFGDAVALEIARRKDISNIKTLWQYHANLE